MFNIFWGIRSEKDIVKCALSFNIFQGKGYKHGVDTLCDEQSVISSKSMNPTFGLNPSYVLGLNKWLGTSHTNGLIIPASKFSWPT